jgi:hypothetical protein
MDTLTGETLAKILQEPKVPLLRQVLRTLGQDRCAAILADTLTTEADGGMLTKDGTRRRTPGGVFFQLVKARATRQERHRLFYTPMPRHQQTPPSTPPQAHPQAPTWEEEHALVSTLPQGEATVKLTLIGRPALEVVQTRPTYVAFRMQGKAPWPAAQRPAPGPGPAADYLAGRHCTAPVEPGEGQPGGPCGRYAHS